MKKETLKFGVYEIEAKAQFDTEDMKKIPDCVALEEGKCLNVVLKGRLLLYHRCMTWGHIKRNCSKWETDKNENNNDSEK